MNPARWPLILYCVLVGGSGWLWLALAPRPSVSFLDLLLFGLLALFVDILSFRVPPGDPHSLVGIVLLTAALAIDPATGALIAAIEGLVFGVALPFIYQTPRTLYTLVARPILRSGIRALGILAGAALATGLGVAATDPTRFLPSLGLLLCLALGYGLLLQGGRLGREYIQGGANRVRTWWRAARRMIISAELAPLPLAALGAVIYRLGPGYFLLAGVAMLAASGTIRRAVLKLQVQRRSVRELAVLNEVSRAIIRSELNVDALCELIYRETSKLVDTSSFHLGLFENDTYTLLIRVQDRVRLNALTVHLEAGDGLMGWIRQTGRALLVEDFTTEMDQLPARPRYQSEHPPRAGVYVPLIAGTDVIGSLSIQSYRPYAFDTNDLRLLSLIADQAAVAITRARAFGEVRQRANQLQAIREVSEHITAILDLDELLPAVVRLIRERFDYHPVHIFTVDLASNMIMFRASTRPADETQPFETLTMRVGQGIVGNAVAERRPILVSDVRADPRYIDDYSATRSELAVPLQVGEQIIGVLDVQSNQPDDFDHDDLFVMRTLAGQIAIAIDSANSYTAQLEEAWILNALLQVSENIGQVTTLDELLPTVVRLPPLLVGCERCFVLGWEHEHEGFRLLAAYGVGANQRTALLGQLIAPEAAPLLARVRVMPEPVRLIDARAHQADLPQIITQCRSGTLEVLPLRARATLLGVLILDYDSPNAIPTRHHQSLYEGAIGQIAKALESALLSAEAAEAERLEQELRVAREIQTTLLPAHPPQLPGWEIAATWRSARLVGGDFYDFWFLAEDHAGADDTAPLSTLGFVIADVSDKGVPAAMFMALARSLVRAAALDGSPPAQALERANRWITRDSESGMFVTLFYGMLQVESGRLCYSCAGHNPPLVYRVATATFEELHTPGIALGVLEEVELHEAVVCLEPGDVLICYTDGLTEAINDATESFGTERLRAAVAQHHHAGVDTILLAVIEAVASFTKGQPPFDDVTLVVMKRVAVADGVSAWHQARTPLPS